MIGHLVGALQSDVDAASGPARSDDTSTGSARSWSRTSGSRSARCSPSSTGWTWSHPWTRSSVRSSVDLMVDHATPNLPSRDLEATTAFYAALGFEPGFRDPGWLILQRASLMLEFFPDPGMDPASTAASCCLRLDDVDVLYAACVAVGLPETHLGWPRLHPPRVEESGMRIGALIDLDGNLLRLVQNP